MIPSRHYLYVETKVLTDFWIYISVPLILQLSRIYKGSVNK